MSKGGTRRETQHTSGEHSKQHLFTAFVISRFSAHPIAWNIAPSVRPGEHQTGMRTEFNMAGTNSIPRVGPDFTLDRLPHSLHWHRLPREYDEDIGVSSTCCVDTSSTVICSCAAPLIQRHFRRHLEDDAAAFRNDAAIASPAHPSNRIASTSVNRANQS